jgi:hypothetical protein
MKTEKRRGKIERKGGKDEIQSLFGDSKKMLSLSVFVDRREEKLFVG